MQPGMNRLTSDVPPETGLFQVRPALTQLQLSRDFVTMVPPTDAGKSNDLGCGYKVSLKHGGRSSNIYLGKVSFSFTTRMRWSENLWCAPGRSTLGM